MSRSIVFQNSQFQWIDVVAPTDEEMRAIASEFGMPPSITTDCLDSRHLPKYERLENHSFFILRTFDPSCHIESDTVQELTRKLAIFFNDSLLITIHRTHQPLLSDLISKLKSDLSEQLASSKLVATPLIPSTAIYEILRSSISSYQLPLEQALGHFEELELSAFNASGSRPYELKQAYLIKRRASVFKRMSRSTLEIIPKVFQSLKHPSLTTFSQDLLEKTEAIHFYSDELLESTYHLMDLQLSIASQKTNERMRILTLFSVFLLPLTVITGIYGMNFEHMPELKLFYGYPYALGLMGLTILSVFLWFKRKGFLS